MGMKKYRDDFAGERDVNGAEPWYTKWMGGPSLALIRNCPTPYGARTVYIVAEPDTYFSQPAVCSVRGRAVKGFITCEDKAYMFHENRF